MQLYNKFSVALKLSFLTLTMCWWLSWGPRMVGPLLRQASLAPLLNLCLPPSSIFPFWSSLSSHFTVCDYELSTEYIHVHPAMLPYLLMFFVLKIGSQTHTPQTDNMPSACLLGTQQKLLKQSMSILKIAFRRVNEMAQKMEMFATKPDNLS